MTGTESRVRVLYLVYWGALEPLGQSLVVPAVRQLARENVDVTLVTVEKPGDLEDAAAVRGLAKSLADHGIRWRALRYHKRPKWPATAFDSLCVFFTAVALRLRHGRFDIVHARTFVAGPVGFLVARLLGSRFVYHNEGFYPDEQVDGGVWRRDSFVHRLARRIERFLYEHADGLVTLSERAKETIGSRLAQRGKRTPIIVVPSAVDLEAFRPPATVPAGPLRVAYLGSVGLRYRLDDAGRFMVSLRELDPGATLTVISRAKRDLVETMLDASGLPRESWTLKELPHSEVPVELARHHAGLFFLVEGLSEHGCSPTKIGEYWASGLPVVSTPNVSDTDRAVRDHGVGVIVRPQDPRSMVDGARALIGLLDDPLLKNRCREAAERIYSLERACREQRRLYGELAA